MLLTGGHTAVDKEGVLHVGERLRKARVQKGLTQGELASPNYSAAYVSVIESGKRAPSEKVLRHFAKRLGVTFEELATGRPPDAEAQLQLDLVEARRALSSGEAPDAIAAYRRIAKRAGQYGLEGLRERAAIGEAFALEVTGEIDRAATLYETLQAEIPDEHVDTKAEAVAGRARCIRLSGDVPYSTYVLEAFLSHIKRNRLTDPEALARLHITLVANYFERGMTKQAAEAADKALSLSPKITDKEKLADMHINVARVLMERGDYSEAFESFSKAEKISRDQGLEAEVGRAYLARSFLLNKQERYTEARADLEAAGRIFEETGNSVNEARTVRQLAVIDRLEGNVDQAIFMLQRSSKMATKDHPASVAISHRELALCYAEKGEPAKVRSHFKKAVDLLEGSGDNYELAITYRCWGDALRDEKDYEKACGLYRSAAVALEAA
jgi:tetratricopeptide (TPR) repeat protein